MEETEPAISDNILQYSKNSTENLLETFKIPSKSHFMQTILDESNNKITNRNFNEIDRLGQVLSAVDLKAVKDDLIAPQNENIPNICFNSFVLDYNDDETEFTTTFFEENRMQTAKIIEYETLQIETNHIIQNIVNGIIEDALNTCEVRKTNFLQVTDGFCRVRRASSLRSLKDSSEESSNTKKIVRFADSLGLDLTNVRTYLDEMPNIPRSAFQDLTKANVSPHGQLGVNQSELVWTPQFAQPELSNYHQRLSRNYVCLQSTSIENGRLLGIIVVENIDYKKVVDVRLTKNNWQTYCDWNCDYLESDCDGVIDRFKFNIDLGKSPPDGHSKLEFAVRFRCRDLEFWDNNCGKNYDFELLPGMNNNRLVDDANDSCCTSYYYGSNCEDPNGVPLTHSLVQEYMAKLVSSCPSNQRSFQKQIRDSEIALEVLIISGIFVLCAICLYIQKVIYFV